MWMLLLSPDPYILYFKNEHDYNDFLLYIKNTYSHRALNTKQFLYSFTSNIGTEFRLRRNDGGIFMLQSHNKKWNW